ncbi:MAG: alkaline phosphatase [Planctomycetales bacterium]|nr:alkaline phosphatase [Planctomycetales bacterium]
MRLFVLVLLASQLSIGLASDPIAEIQAKAIADGKADFGHWGPNPDKYSSWTSHSNRLIPIYTFGRSLSDFTGANSVYRSEEQLRQIYGQLPSHTLNPNAQYCDQTDVYRIQQAAVVEGAKRVILFVFDGMDWQTTWAAATAKKGEVAYRDGRGTGLAFQDYRGTETDFGFFVTSPHNNGTNASVDNQQIANPGGKTGGGYDAERCGQTPWAPIADANYPITAGGDLEVKHAYTDSASSATSMTAGIKTYNNAINVDSVGREVLPIARTLQQDGFAIGVVSSVPISHATPACAYANNVHRSDYQDLTRDLLGLPSIFHPGGLSGVDVLLGAGWGEEADKDGAQGANFVPGNQYLTSQDLHTCSSENGGSYVVAQRTSGKEGVKVLDSAVYSAIDKKQRLFGFFGVKGGHLPYQTADGSYNPVASVGNPASAAAEVYSPDDLSENVTLSQMTQAALDVLDSRSSKWWLMVEAGDVDWANHSNNIDNSIGAVLSGEMAFQTVVNWIEDHGGWQDTLVVLTADHGHYLVLDQPELLGARAQ